MKKQLSAFLLAVHLFGVAQPALAAYPTQDLPSQVGYQASRVPKSRRIMVVTPERWSDVGAVQIDYAVDLNGVYQCLDMAREQGADVHFYNSKIFENYAGGTKLWREAGNYYSLAIILNPTANIGVAGVQRMWNGDSTNVQILVVGGTRSNGAVWAADTTMRGMLDAGSTVMETQSSIRFAGLVPHTSSGLGTDSIWGNNLASGRLISTNDSDLAGYLKYPVHSGIINVKRVLHPFRTVYPTIAWANSGSDTANANMPAGTDSVALPNEYLGPIWKVTYAPSAVNPDTSEVWFFKFTSSSTQNVQQPHLIWACISRFVDVAPIKYAVDFDDVTDVNATGTPPGTDAGQGSHPRWRQSAAETLLTRFARYGLVVGSNGINPGNAPGYVRGHAPAGEQTAAWDGYGLHLFPNGQPAHTYIKRLMWTHHSHDSTNSSITSNLVGGYGGYPPSNGVTSHGNQQMGRRFASRWNPGANDANNVGAGGNFGIVQRLEYSDSVRIALGVRPDRPPYLTFPANQMLPINWKSGRSTVVDYTPNNIFASSEASCPIDSVLWAFDYFLNRRQDNGTGRIWLRSGILDGAKFEALWADRDSFVAATLCMYPRERWATRVGSRLVQAEVVHSFNQGGGTRAQYLADAGFRAGYLIGLNNRVQKSERHRTNYGESSSGDADKNTIMTPGTGWVNFPARQSTRVHYFHPSGLGGVPSAMGDYSSEVFLLGIHSNIRAMDAIAGRPASKCVPAWQVYEK